MTQPHITHETYKGLTPEEQEKYGEEVIEMYDDNPGYEEWIKSTHPHRDKANGYRLRYVHYLKPVEAQQSEAEGFDSLYQDLFTHMYRDHNLILLESEMSDIVEAAKPLWQGEITALQQEVERLKEAKRWIHVSERLPEVGMPVLVFMEGRITKKPLMKVDELTSKTEWRFTSPGFITHWQPLPPPPTN